MGQECLTLTRFKRAGNRRVNGLGPKLPGLAIKQVDVVICSVGVMQMADQVKIISAIKEAGNVKRYLPSEFGFDPDSASEISVEPAKSVVFGVKNQVRRAIEAEGIPHTYVCCNYFAGCVLPSLFQPGATTPLRDKVIILGDGNVKGVYNKEVDIATYTIRAVNDPRTLNKILHVRPPKNRVLFNEVVTIWEKLIGKTLEKTYIPEEQIHKDIQELPFPDNVLLSLNHLHFNITVQDQSIFWGGGL